MKFDSIDRYVNRGLFGLSRRYRHKILEMTYGVDGINFLNQDWDTLIILDSCRYDVFKTVNSIPGKLTKYQSLGTHTYDVVRRNFENQKLDDVLYLSDNPVTGRVKEDGYINIYKFIDFWNDQPVRNTSGFESATSVVDPKPVIEKSLILHDEYPNKRHILHLLPPHTPHLIKDGEYLSPNSPYRNYDAVSKDNVSREKMRAVYRENLDYVLQKIEHIIERINGKIVITSDHGELLGEGFTRIKKILDGRWGTDWERYNWGHYTDIRVPELVNIPWLEIDSETRRRIVPETPVKQEIDHKNTDDFLQALGYQ